jgi:hemerythrin superfamily protein
MLRPIIFQNGGTQRSFDKETLMPATRGRSRSPVRAKPARAIRARKTAGSRQLSAISILRADHKLVDDLFKQYEKAKAQGRKQILVDRICREVTVHATVEEEIFYPAVRSAIKDKDMMDEADIEHASAKELIAQLEAGKPGDDHYDAKVKVLGEYIRHHVKEEQTEIFPRAQKTKLDMIELGSQIQTRKAELTMDHRPPRKAAEPSKSSIFSRLTFG